MEQDRDMEHGTSSTESDLPERSNIDAEGFSLIQEVPGRYTSPREHGRGGIGRIFVVRDENLGREVALKELMPLEEMAYGSGEGEKTAPLTTRFLREACITGQLEHPSIVPVHELGQRQNGTVYYTMKLVRGHTLKQAFKSAATLQERLKLLPHFVDLCQAIAYAHSRDIIHRDIKPSNVMVGEFGETVVIDWGLAKTLGEEDIYARKLERALRELHIEDGEDTTKTAYGEALGSPVYMSPEQALGELDRLDERSDIYSLGAVLYELLAGRAPYAGMGKRAVPFKVAGKRPEPLALLEPESPVELVAICERAMQLEPGKRYSSANELADEVQGFLSGGLVRAYRYRFSDHLRRFIARHRTAVATVTASLLILITGLSAATVWSLRERRRAELEAATATQVSQFLVDIFEVSEPGQARGNTVTAREVLDRGADRIRKTLGDQPLTQARLMATIGSVYMQLGLYPEARALLAEALQLREQQLGPDHLEVAESIRGLAALHHSTGEYDEAIALLERSREICERSAGPDSVMLARNLHLLALTTQRKGRYEKAEQLYQQALSIYESELGPQYVETAKTLRALGSLYVDLGRLDEAEKLVQRAVLAFETSLGDDHPDVGIALNHLATIYSYQGKFAEAEPLFRQALAIAEKTLGPDHSQVAGGLNNLAVNLWYQGRFDEIEPLYLRAISIWEAAVGREHPSYAAALANLAELYWKQGRYEDSEPLYREALSIHTEALGAEHPEVAQVLYGLANLYRDQGDSDTAEPLYRRSLAIREKILSPSHPQLIETLTEYAALLRASGRDQDAAELQARIDSE
jgi:serine/threonine protein kinase/Tfp pilus assembly protein PilF